jgi:hypothetical protein
MKVAIKTRFVYVWPQSDAYVSRMDNKETTERWNNTSDAPRSVNIVITPAILPKLASFM